VVDGLQAVGPVDVAGFPIWESEADSGAVQQLIRDAGPEGAVLGTPAADWPGLWRVVYAPHIRTLGSLALSKFDVYYDIFPVTGGGLGVRSFVRFEGPAWAGWLSAAGRVREVEPPLEVPGFGPRPTSEIDFTDFWVDLDKSQPRTTPDEADDVLRRIAAPFFIKEISRFPTLLFDPRRGLTIFRFPPLGVEIAASRIGPSGSAVRPLNR